MPRAPTACGLWCRDASEVEGLSCLFEALSCLFEALSRLFEALSRLFEALSRLFEALSCLFEALSRLFEALSRQVDPLFRLQSVAGIRRAVRHALLRRRNRSMSATTDKK